MAIRVQHKPEDFGRCGCGRRQYCDGSHGLSEAEWQVRLAAEREAEQEMEQGAAKAAVKEAAVGGA